MKSKNFAIFTVKKELDGHKVGEIIQLYRVRRRDNGQTFYEGYSLNGDYDHYLSINANFCTLYNLNDIKIERD